MNPNPLCDLTECLVGNGLKAFKWRVPLGAESICGHGASGYLAGNGLLSAFGMSFLAAESFLTKPAD
ncbi:MAG: hypothetical protein HOK48_08735 [Actinobacteria bacterium]|nr:hypothetical protein [Actinomycetota bacterium]MBT5502249.1 hypothetical protein [Actinomycetota bacterium]MBT5807447.1 hypothetical protein [Actinomycetota bacterium]